MHVILMVLCIIDTWLSSAVLIYWMTGDWNTAAAFADTFGAVNALFSGLALSGVVLAILLQKKELELQRNELELARKGLERSAQAQEASQIALHKQVDSVERTITLNAINTLLSAYAASADRLEGKSVNMNQKRQTIEAKTVQLIEQTEKLLREKGIRVD